MTLLVSALERSANLHLRHLLPHLKDVEIKGIFDSSLGNPVVDLQSLSIMGFVDAFKKLRFFLKLKEQMVELAASTDKVLLIDASGFNLPLAKAIKKRYPNKEIIYYILPQAWAWRRGRVNDVVRYVDRACSILPFEKEIYPTDYNIRYVGHPLLDEIATFKETPTPNGPVVFMPGSRKSEIKALMPVFKEVRKRIDKEALLVIPPYFSKEEKNLLYGDISAFNTTSNAHKALLMASFAFICSGTATLEASLIGTPLALAYIAKPIDYFIAKRFAHINKVGLANIMLGDMHPEFLQKAVTPQNLLAAYHNSNAEEFLKKSRQLRNYLQHGSAKKVAEVINA